MQEGLVTGSSCQQYLKPRSMAKQVEAGLVSRHVVAFLAFCGPCCAGEQSHARKLDGMLPLNLLQGRKVQMSTVSQGAHAQLDGALLAGAASCTASPSIVQMWCASARSEACSHAMPVTCQCPDEHQRSSQQCGSQGWCVCAGDGVWKNAMLLPDEQ